MAGRSEAASIAWTRFRPHVQATLRRILGPSDDIPDLMQDVFIRFFDKVHELRSVDALRPFVIGIAFRRASEEIRRRHVRRTLRPMVENHFAERTVHWDPVAHHTAARLFDVLDGLGADGRIYALRVLDGEELADIARKMGMSLSTVRRRLARVTRRMARCAQAEHALPGRTQALPAA